MNPQDFAALPLAGQLDHLRGALALASARDLLELCAAIRDHAPLSWLARQLCDTEWFLRADNRQWFGEFLLARSETAVHQILRALMADLGQMQPEVVTALADTLVWSLQRIELARLSSMCLIDRALKHNFPDRRNDHVTWVIERVCAALERGALDAVTAALLAQVPSRVNDRMRELASRHGAEFATALHQKRVQMAADAISILGNAPKAVSQANAEELLARRVYTDPGHFLIELLQNAEDSGATTWRVIFDRDRIVVWHDGAAFDARDLVGVTSIGQTTKRKQQIGFFGVGFKSVFEVTARPQVYSDVFNFEIADVSIPKVLGRRPPDLPPDGTVLVLPLRNPDDPVRSPKGLFEKARALDPCVLFTLPCIDVIDLSLTKDAPGGPRRHAIRERHQRWASIRQSPDGWEKRFLLQADDFQYTAGEREAGRADHTRIMVGVSLNDFGVPSRLPTEAATIYSYLPTDERSGLAFWIQGHFDVPVDRERITAESSWNRWILATVPLQLARIGQQIVARDDVRPHLRRRMAAGFLSILPLTRELSNPVFHIIVDGLRAALAEVEIVPVGARMLVTPGEAIVATTAQRALFGEEPLSARWLDPNAQPDHSLHLVDTMLSERGLETLALLGVPTLDTARLIDILERILHDVGDGERPRDDRAPSFLRVPDLDKLRRLYDQLLAEIERLERDDRDDRDQRDNRGAGHDETARADPQTGPRDGHTSVVKPLAGPTLARLINLPMICDEDDNLRRSPTAALGTPAMRRIYDGLRRFTHPDLDERCPEQVGARLAARRLSPLWERLQLEVVDVATLMDELEQQLADAPRPMATLSETRLPGTSERKALIIEEILANGSTPQKRRVARLPLFEGADGRYWPAADNATDDRGVLLCDAGPTGQLLLEFYRCDGGDTRPVLAHSAAHGPAGALLRQLQVPALDIECLVSDIGRIPKRLGLDEPERLHALHQLLEALRAEIPERLQRVLAGLAIWPDRKGRPGVLRAPGLSAQASAPYLVRIPADEAVVELFPTVRFLDERVRDRAHVRDMGVAALGAAAVVDALAPDAQDPLRIEPSMIALARAHHFLLDRLSDIGSRVREKLAVYPAFLDDRGDICELSGLCRGDAEIRSIYAASESNARRFIDPDGSSMKLVSALELESHLASADARALLADLDSLRQELVDKPPQATPLIASADNLQRILQYIASRHAELPITLLERATQTPMFLDQHGVLGTLADAGVGVLDAAAGNQLLLANPEIRPLLLASGIRVISEHVQQPTARIAKGAGLAAVDVPLCIGQLQDAHAVEPGGPRHLLQSGPALQVLYQLLAEQRELLAERYPVTMRENQPPASFTLSRLYIWETRAHGVCSANELVDVAPVRALLTSDQMDETTRTAFDRVTLADSARSAWDALQPLVVYRSLATYVAELAHSLARDDQPLTRQHPLLSSTSSVTRLLELYLADDGRGSARPPEYRAADQRLPMPLVTGDERLTREPLMTCDRSTLLVLEGLPIARKLLHPDLHSEALVRALSLSALPLPHVLSALAGTGDDAQGDLTRPRRRVAAHPILHAPDRRARLYEWLEQHEAAIFASHECCQLLARSRLFPSERGTLLAASELVTDPDLPDLDVDWTPSSEIPERLITRLTRYLDVGSPAIGELIERHLLSAYHRAVRAKKSERAGAIVRYLAKALGDHSVRDIRALLLKSGESGFPLEDQYGGFLEPSALLLPPPDLEAHITAVWQRSYPQPAAKRYPEHSHRLLIALGVQTEPDVARVREAMQRPSLTRDAAMGLAAICSRLFWSGGDQSADELLAQLPVRTAPWLLDGTGCPRRPGELFAWSAEIEALIGSFPELYPAPEVVRILPDRLLGKLGLRALDKVELSHILAHLDRCIATQQPLPFRVYQWMEQGLSAGWLQPAALQTELQRRTWVWAHERYFHHSKVIGSWAVPYFGERRGYWERGFKDCPRLCRLFGIPRDADKTSVTAFLRELGGEIQERGDRTLLADEPALRHMLLSCYALLGEAKHPVDRNLPVILSGQNHGAPGGSADSGRAELRLLPASSARVFRSDTPTLERLFAGVGTFYLVARGASDQRSHIDEFYDQMNIRRLRSAFTVEVDGSSGRDVTGEWRTQVQELRATLRALDAVLPRIRRQREHLAAEGWLYEELLAPLTTSRPIRVIEQLRVRYRLDGVGDARADIPAAYDRRQQELMVDAQILADPHEHTTGLALGLMSCIYDGPGEDQLVDIIEILLPMRTQEAMDRYLDRRHFPVVEDGRARHPIDSLGERIGAILDLGLGHRLRRKFSDELADATLEVWRDPGLLAPLRDVEVGPRDRAAYAARATLILLDAIGVSSPSTELVATLTQLLAVRSLSELPAELLAVARTDEPLLSDIHRPADPPASTRSAVPGPPAEQPAVGGLDELSLDQLSAMASARQSGAQAASQTSDQSPEQSFDQSPENSTSAGSWSGLSDSFDAAAHRGLMDRLRARLRDPMSRLSSESSIVTNWTATESDESDESDGPHAGPHSKGSEYPFTPEPSTSAESRSKDASDPAELADLLALFEARASLAEAGEAAELPGEPDPTEGWFASAEDAGLTREQSPFPIADAPPAPEELGLWRRISNFFGGGRKPDPTIFERPSWTQAANNCLEPRAGIPAQLWTSPNAFDQIARRPPSAMLHFTPPKLPLPWLYAAQSFGVFFDPESQGWSSGSQLPIGRLLSHCRSTGSSVRFAGQIQPGVSLLPVPLYSRLLEPLRVESLDDEPATDRIELLDNGQHSGQVTVRVTGDRALIVHYAVELYEPPAVTGRRGHIARDYLNAAQQPTVALKDLPREVRTYVETQRRAWREPWELCLSVQDFVRRRYLYDSNFATHIEVVAMRDQLRAGQGNHHLQLLHASADESYLGRGICYELNVLCVELLRHLGVPTLVVTGWVLDEGAISRPDHLFALALVPGAHGPVAVPLDAATGSQGPIRELSRRAPRAETRPANADQSAQIPPLPGIWNPAAAEHAAGAAESSTGLARINQAEFQHLFEQARMLSEAVPHILSTRGRAMPADLDHRQRLSRLRDPDSDIDAVRAILDQLYRVAATELGRPVLVGALLAVMRGDFDGVTNIPELVQELVSMGLVAVKSEPRYRVDPSWHGGPAAPVADEA